MPLRYGESSELHHTVTMLRRRRRARLLVLAAAALALLATLGVISLRWFTKGAIFHPIGACTDRPAFTAASATGIITPLR